MKCPRCGAVSQHPVDTSEGYCGRCHAVTECRCDARYEGCEHPVPCPAPTGDSPWSPYFCRPCDERRIAFIDGELAELSAYLESGGS